MGLDLDQMDAIQILSINMPIRIDIIMHFATVNFHHNSFFALNIFIIIYFVKKNSRMRGSMHCHILSKKILTHCQNFFNV